MISYQHQAFDGTVDALSGQEDPSATCDLTLALAPRIMTDPRLTTAAATNVLNGRFLVVDVEATCSSCRVLIPRAEMEIIEFGAVLVEAGAELGEFNTFIRPVRHPRLTDYCSQLTSIRQEDVDGAPPFQEALANLLEFSGPPTRTTFASWGRFDARILASDCSYHQLPVPAFAGYVDLKRAIGQALETTTPLPIGEALQRCGMQFLGTPHRGLDDARNAARLLAWLACRDAGTS